MPEGRTGTGAGPLLLIAAAAVGVLLFPITKLKLHAFLALVLVSLLVALVLSLFLRPVRGGGPAGTRPAVAS